MKQSEKTNRLSVLLKLKLLAVTLFAGITLLAACSDDNEEDLLDDGDDTDDCGAETVSLADDIEPIIASNCAVSGCHVTGSQFPDFTQKQNIISHASSIRTRTSNGSMPPPQSGRSLSSEQISKISCWVENGAKDD